MKKNQLLIDNLRTHILQSLENLEELLEQEDINLRTLRIKELEISFTVTRRTKSEYLKSLDFWYNPLTNYKEYQIYLLLQCHQEMGIQSQGNRNPSST